jgi:hypothetical protein
MRIIRNMLFILVLIQLFAAFDCVGVGATSSHATSALTLQSNVL